MTQTSAKAGTSLAAKVVFTLFLLSTLVFIFYQSSRVGAVSSSLSLPITSYINEILLRAGLDIQLSETTVRKLGHVAEYTMLGFWLVLTLRAYTGRILAFASWPLLLGLGFAVSDEFLQQFIPGRVGSVTDVVIDFCGILFGGGLALFLILLVSAAARGFQNLRH